MLYFRKLFTQDLRDGKQIAFPKEPSESFFRFSYTKHDSDRRITFYFDSKYSTFSEFEGRAISTRLYSATSEARMDGEVKAFLRDEIGATVDDIVLFKTKDRNFTEFYFSIIQAGSPYYDTFLELTNSANHTVVLDDGDRENENEPDIKLQTIYFGTPGSGKSFKVKEITASQSVIRTTFHPDTDYATFVGSYKPVMDGKEISYCFVKQAFLKAYLAAWKKFDDVYTNAKTRSFVNVSNEKFTITNVQQDHVVYDKEFSMRKSASQSVWNDSTYWNNDVFEIPSRPHPGRSAQEAICIWIFGKFGKSSFDAGLTAFISEIKANGSIKCKAKQQEYDFCLSGDEDILIVKTYSGRSTRDTIKKEYENADSNSNSVAAGVANILRDIDPEDFDKAWEELQKEFATKADDRTSPKRQYLVIEEINRGNCAQIFGDIFQLLDRQDNGFSSYPIESDTDIQKAIAKAFQEEDDYKLSNALNIDYIAPDYESAFGASLSDDIVNGRVMLMPPNLYILATMNTSDQSLFPMDSAFKRRWDWEYVPIEPDNAKSQFTITIGGLKYFWKDFLIAANDYIKDVSESEDKQMGNFFIKNNIGEDEFKSKVMFYLWSEVCKEEYGHKSFFRNGNNGNAEFMFNDLYPDGSELLKGFMKYLGLKYEGEA